MSGAAGSEPFRAFYAQARAAGLRLTNHAGETTGPEAIREALSIGSERIGHALSAIQDPALMRELKTSGIPLRTEPHFERPHRRMRLLLPPTRCAATSTPGCW